MALGTSIRADYVYDGKSRLASRVTQNQTGAGTTRLFHDNDNRVIAEVNAAGTAIREYIWLDDLPVAVLDGSVSQTSPTLFFVHADHLNRPVAMSNAAKSWVWRAQYEPFGAVHQIVGPAANDNRFPGQWFQLEAGLAYNWHRHYDATLGRYTQADPIGFRGGVSLYGYAKQKPFSVIDFDGLCPCGDPSTLVASARNDNRDWSLPADRHDVSRAFGPGQNKCNLFVDTHYENTGYNLPNIGGSFLSRLLGKYPPGAQSLSDPGYAVPGWPVVSGPAQTGDLIAFQGHVGISTVPGRTISASPRGVIENDWANRDGNLPVIRRCTCPR